MTVPPGFFSQQPAEPADFSHSLTAPLSSLPSLSSQEMLQQISRAWGPFASSSHSGLSGCPQMDPTLGIHWTHPSCPALLPTERSSSNTWGSLLFKETFIFYLDWSVWAGHRQTQVLASFLQLIACQMDKAAFRRPVALSLPLSLFFFSSNNATNHKREFCTSVLHCVLNWSFVWCHLWLAIAKMEANSTSVGVWQFKFTAKPPACSSVNIICRPNVIINFIKCSAVYALLSPLVHTLFR